MSSIWQIKKHQVIYIVSFLFDKLGPTFPHLPLCILYNIVITIILLLLVLTVTLHIAADVAATVLTF